MLSLFLAALENDRDRERFRALYDRYGPRMERTALRILRDQSDAEDAVQNAFLQVIRHFEKIDSIPCEELPFWLVSIVKNEALTILRKRKRELSFEDWDAVTETAEDVSSYHELVDLVQRLPETYRAVLEMKLLLGYPDKEIAARLGLTETAVSTRANRGRALLRKIMEEGELV